MICHTGTCVRKNPICVPYVPSFSDIWTINFFCLNSNTTVFCTLSLLLSELSINHFPSQVFSHLHLLWYYGSFICSVILSIWKFPSVKLLWYYGYYILSILDILDCPTSDPISKRTEALSSLIWVRKYFEIILSISNFPGPQLLWYIMDRLFSRFFMILEKPCAETWEQNTKSKRKFKI